MPTDGGGHAPESSRDLRPVVGSGDPMHDRIEREARPDGIRFRLVGEIDVRTAPAILDAVLAGVEENPQVVELNFAGVTFMDSSGLGLLVSIKRKIDASGTTRLLLAELPSRIHRVLVMTRLDSVFAEALQPEAAAAPVAD